MRLQDRARLCVPETDATVSSTAAGCEKSRLDAANLKKKKKRGGGGNMDLRYRVWRPSQGFDGGLVLEKLVQGLAAADVVPNQELVVVSPRG